MCIACVADAKTATSSSGFRARARCDNRIAFVAYLAARCRRAKHRILSTCMRDRRRCSSMSTSSKCIAKHVEQQHHAMHNTRATRTTTRSRCAAKCPRGALPQVSRSDPASTDSRVIRVRFAPAAKKSLSPPERLDDDRSACSSMQSMHCARTTRRASHSHLHRAREYACTASRCRAHGHWLSASYKFYVSLRANNALARCVVDVFACTQAFMPC